MTEEAVPKETISAIMRGYAAQRRRVTRHCLVCGKLLENVTTRRLYCSNRCAIVASRERRGRTANKGRTNERAD